MKKECKEWDRLNEKLHIEDSILCDQCDKEISDFIEKHGDPIVKQSMQLAKDLKLNI